MIIYFGIGTNLGDREANLRTALRLLDERVGQQLASSSIYRSAPQGFLSDNEFANIVVAYHTTYSLEDLLLITQKIEQEMGRTEKSINGIYHDRVIDIDLLKATHHSSLTTHHSSLTTHHSSLITHHSSNLTLPHPRMRERDFVMIPLKEVEDILNSK
jgi:2-amino-4-hydroxy-6-hydroxymethyldihydropteridine diphosphokinase